MARRPLVAGNWKLNKTIPEALSLVTELKNALASIRDVDIVVAPPHTALWAVQERLSSTNIAVSAQEIFYEDSGAFTGKVSAPMVKDAGCTYTIVGHSERRQYFHETVETSNKRVKAALKHELIPILCVGESLAERQQNATTRVVAEQLDGGIAGLSVDQLKRLVIAYEPVWAIGTGQVATPKQAQEVHAMIRERLRSKDPGMAEGMRILYGGSVKPDNARELNDQADIDGSLVGGASLKAADFIAIVRATRPTS